MVSEATSAAVLKGFGHSVCQILKVQAWRLSSPSAFELDSMVGIGLSIHDREQRVRFLGLLEFQLLLCRPSLKDSLSLVFSNALITSNICFR